MIVGKRTMPRSKHHTKKMSDSKRRKRNNIRKAITKYLSGRTQLAAKVAMVPEKDRDKKFTRVFPDKLLKKAKII